jgi:competence protein ComEC
MKLPTLCLVSCFAGGILLSRNAAAHLHLALQYDLLAAAFLLLAGVLALGRARLIPALLLGATAWVCLGFAAAGFEQASAPTNLASTLIETGKLDSSVPLRWRGHLRSDPLSLPWGTRYEIGLYEVESASGAAPVTGGLRVTWYREVSNPVPPPAVRAGDRVEVLVRALPIRNYGDPGSFDFRGYLSLQGVQLEGTLRSSRLMTLIARPGPTVVERLARARGDLLRSIDHLFASQPEQAALARAMLLGDRSFVERDRVVEYQRTGVYHVLVLAGLHVGALTAFFIWAGRALRLKTVALTLLTLAALAAYLSIVENRPPILRAVLMAAIYLCARLFYRRMDFLNIAALSALAILIVRPSEIADASFLLSYAAIGTLGALALPWVANTSEPYLRGLSHLEDVGRDVSHVPRVIQFRIEMRALTQWVSGRLPRRAGLLASRLLGFPFRFSLYLWEMIVISAILQLGMLPPLAYYFHRVALAGPLANFPAVLLTGLIVPLGFLILGATVVWHALAQILARVLGVLLTLLDATVHWFAQWHGASYRIPGPSLLLVAGFAGSVILLSAAVRARRRAWQWAGAFTLGALSVLIATFPFAPDLSGKGLEVTVLDIGQGDSLFLAFPGGRTMLIDAGGALGSFHAGGMRSGIDVGEEVVSPYLWSRGLKQIDIVALTHAHQDHLGGLPAILNNFRVRQLWVGRDIDTPEFQAILALARERGVRIVHHRQGDTFKWGPVSGQILWPEDLAEQETAKNDDSLVIRLTDGAQSFLLPGDIELPSERTILSEGKNVGATFLKVAHHGSKTSTTDAFLTAVHPAFAAISVGTNNPFGQPSPEVLERLHADGVRVYRTDLDGAITATTDGKILTVSSFLHNSP